MFAQDFGHSCCLLLVAALLQRDGPITSSFPGFARLDILPVVIYAFSFVITALRWRCLVVCDIFSFIKRLG